MSVWLFYLEEKTRWYEGWTLLYFLVDLLEILVSLAWEYLGLSLDCIWTLNLACKLLWFWKHLLDLNLKIKSACCLDWHLAITLAHGKDIWLEFNLEHWLDWCLAPEKDIWLDYNWDFHLNLQIQDMCFLEQISVKLLASAGGGRYFFHLPLWRSFHI